MGVLVPQSRRNRTIVGLKIASFYSDEFPHNRVAIAP